MDEGIDPSTAVVLTSVEGASSALETARWIAGGADCSPNEIEIHTARYSVVGSSLVAEGAGDIPFSFLVP